MNALDFSYYILSYNFIIGILTMLASEKIGAYAGYYMSSYRERVSRITHIGIFTFGACAAAISFGIYIAAYVLKL